MKDTQFSKNEKQAFQLVAMTLNFGTKSYSKNEMCKQGNLTELLDIAKFPTIFSAKVIWVLQIFHWYCPRKVEQFKLQIIFSVREANQPRTPLN